MDSSYCSACNFFKLHNFSYFFLSIDSVLLKIKNYNETYLRF